MSKQQIEAVAKALSAEGAWCGDCDEPDYERCPECRQSCQILARAALAAAHPTITTHEGTDTTPDGTTLLDADGDVYLKTSTLMHEDVITAVYWQAGPQGRFECIALPATVLHWGNK